MNRQKRASVALAHVLIVLTAWLSLVPLLHGDDRACNPAIVVHASSQHRISAGGFDGNSPVADDHCLACHLFRSSRGAVAWKFMPQGVDEYALVVIVAGPLIVMRAGVPIPGRAPPFQV